MRVRATLTVVKEYEIDPKAYNVETLEQAIEIDKEGILDDPFAFIDDATAKANIVIEEVGR